MADDMGPFGRAEFPDGIALSALTRAPFSLVITDTWLEDNPIVYVNRAFTEVTGYSESSVLGRNCRFLQGSDTKQAPVRDLREAVEAQEQITVELVNYRADGTPFRNRLLITPLVSESREANAQGEPRYFLGVQMARPMEEQSADDRVDTLDRALSEVQHRVKNHLSMIVGMIRMQARQDRDVDGAKAGYEALSRRIEALQLLYAEITDASTTGADDPVKLGAYLSRVAAAISRIDGRPGVRCDIDTVPIHVPFQTATRIGLLVSEVMTNAFQHAFDGREAGRVAMLMDRDGDDLLIEVVDDGNGLANAESWPAPGSLGSRIVEGLRGDLGADLNVRTGSGGTSITLRVPGGAA